MARRYLPWVVLLAATLHVVGVARSYLPAQDGLKFLRFARQFHSRPWIDVVRDCDQHPLYPACIAIAQPAVGLFAGPDPDSWRIAAQGVSVVAMLGLIAPLFGLTRALFDERAAILAALMFVLLPATAELGHDTLSDALALCATASALGLGEAALRARRLRSALGCGVAAGLGYWARPEVAVVPLALLVASTARGCLTLLRRARRARTRETALIGASFATASRGRAVATSSLTFLVMVGSYALVKGEVSEKLALRRVGAIASRHDVARKVAHPLPPGLDDPRWDFSAKEESGHPARLSPGRAVGRLARDWAEGLGWVLAPFAVWGAFRVRAGVGRRLVGAYVLFFAALLVRHATTLGYLSGRHAASLVLAALPWAAAGAIDLWGRLAGRRGWDGARQRRRRLAAVSALVLAGVACQLARPGHPSRWGHRAAGRWLAEHAGPHDAVLDTRGWAAFVSQRPSYDYWHVRQALTDSRLSYVVVGADELAARSRRAETLRALLAYATEPVASFPGRRGDPGADVRVFRFHRPDSWEGLRP